MKRTLVVVTAAIAVLVGCGETDKTTIGGPNATPGMLKRDIDTSRNVADEASQKTREGEADVYGKTNG